MLEDTSKKTTARICASILALIAWFSLGLQLYLTDQSITNFFSYFTILSNLMIAVSLAFSSLTPASGLGRFFSRLSVQSAIALYIFIVSLVYNLVLRGIWILTGWQLFVDNMLHVVIPVMYLLYWAFFRTAGKLRWQDGFLWVFFPLLYLIYSLIRGSVVNWYPYPFLNAVKIGYGKVVLNIGVMLVVFLGAGLMFVFLTRSLRSKVLTN